MENATKSNQQIKASYFNLLASLFVQERIKSSHAKYLIKWGIQLGISPEELDRMGKGLNNPSFALPIDEIEKLESIYHLVHMIYLDQIVEDVELEIASMYATRLGFKSSLVGDLFKSIATTEFDLSSPEDVRKEVIDFPVDKITSSALIILCGFCISPFSKKRGSVFFISSCK